MRASAALLLNALILVGCVQSKSLVCENAGTCPSGTHCDDHHGLCLTDAQTTACRMLPDGARCDAAGTAGICDRELCVPGCGDGVQGVNERDDSNEQCDDGNFASHDGCSSACQLEIPAWSEAIGPTMGRINHVAAYHVADKQLVIFGGLDANGTRQDQWVRDPAGRWSVMPTTPIGPRRSTAMAYDSDRAKLVLFGGMDGDGVVHDDVWEYDASGWTKVTVPAGPPARHAHGMVYDPARQQMILFGGSSRDVFFNDTWTLDLASRTWTKLMPTASPEPRREIAMAWDGERVVLFGGESPGFALRGDTWEFNPATSEWIRIVEQQDPPVSAPARRYGAAMASPEPGRVIMVGGSVGGIASAETWQLVGRTWTKLDVAAPSTPPGRAFAAMTFDPLVSVDGDPEPEPALVLSGGGTATDPEPFGDVWHLSDRWVEHSDFHPVKPLPRYTSLVYDTAGEQILMFGGFATFAPVDTWAFGASGWSLLRVEEPPGQNEPACEPPRGALRRRTFHLLTYDAARDVTVMFGGLRECEEFNGDTHEWSRSTNAWMLVDAADPPPARLFGAMAYDPVARVSVLFGGIGLTASGVATLGDTWEYDGQWRARPDAGGPGPRAFSAIAFHPARGHLIMVDEDSRTWAYIDHVWTEVPTETKIDPPRGSGALTYDRNLGLVLFGGGALTSDARFNDLWRLVETERNGEPVARWERFVAAGELPVPRTTSLVSDPCRRELVMFGGRSRATFLDDTWQLQFRSLTPDEVCDNLVDDDGDLQIDDADPDCSVRCRN